MTPLIGVAEDAMHRDALQRLADAYEAKCGSDWHFASETACSVRARMPPPCATTTS